MLVNICRLGEPIERLYRPEYCNQTLDWIRVLYWSTTLNFGMVLMNKIEVLHLNVTLNLAAFLRDCVNEGKSLIAEWLEQASQWHEMYGHDLEVMSLNPGWVELGVRSTSALSCTWTKTKNKYTYLTLKVLNFWKFTSYCSLKLSWSGMGEVVPARTSPTLHPSSPPTVHQLSRLAL